MEAFYVVLSAKIKDLSCELPEDQAAVADAMAESMVRRSTGGLYRISTESFMNTSSLVSAGENSISESVAFKHSSLKSIFVAEKQSEKS